MSLSENIEKVHEVIMSEEGLSLSDLPIDIQKRIKGWNLLYARLVKEDDEKLFRSLVRRSIELGDEIQNFIETDYEDETDEEKVDDSKETPPTHPKEAEEKTNDDPTPEPAPVPTPEPEPKEETKKDVPSNKVPTEQKSDEVEGEEKTAEKEKSNADKAESRSDKKTTGISFGNLAMEKKILSIVNSNSEGRISINQLEAIIGKEPDYPEQEVHTIKLRKVYLASSYRLA